MLMTTAHMRFFGLRERTRRALRDRRSLQELHATPPDELRHIAQDVGLSEQGLRSLGCSHPGPSELMPQRLRQLGLDPGYVKMARTSAYRDLERVCASCKAWRRCARDLARGDVQAGMRAYCLNAPTLDALLLERPPPR
jgi:hypothetical protein